MSFADISDAAVVETIAGETVTLPILGWDDVAAMSRQIQNENKLKAVNALALQDQAGRQNVAAWYDDHDLDIDELTKMPGEMGGARRVLTASIVKGGRKDHADAVFKAIVREHGVRAAIALAMEVSGIYYPIKRKPEATVPNVETAGQGEASPPASESTGDSSSSSPASASAEPTLAP